MFSLSLNVLYLIYISQKKKRKIISYSLEKKIISDKNIKILRKRKK